MTAVGSLKDKGTSRGSISPSAKSTQENSNPSGGIITVIMLVTVLAAVGGIAFHLFRKRKQKPKELEDASIKQ